MLHPPVQSWQQNVGLSRWRSPRSRTWRPLAQWRKTEGFLDRKIRTERGVWWMELCQGSWVDCYYRTVTSMEVVSYAGEVMVQKQKNILVKTRHFTIRHYHTHPYYPVHRHLCILGPGNHGQRYPWSSSVVPGLPGPLSPSCNRNELLPLQTYTKDDNERTKEEEDIISM